MKNLPNIMQLHYIWKMRERKFNTEIAKNILRFIVAAGAATTLTAALVVMPGLGLVVKEFLQWNRAQNYRKRHEIKKTFNRLIKERLIKSKFDVGGLASFEILDKGKRKLLEYNFEEIKLARPEKWDGKWRFVVFDLPKSKSRSRNLWRSKLKSLGFCQFQKSVWVHAFPCRDEIDFLGEYLAIRPFIRIIEAESFDGEEDFEDSFSG